MSQLANMISPDYAIITMVGQSHLDGLGSVENVAEEKSDIFNVSNKRTKVFFPESCLGFSAFQEKLWKVGLYNFEIGCLMNLRLEKMKLILNFGLKQKQTDSSTPQFLASRVPIFFNSFRINFFRYGI